MTVNPRGWRNYSQKRNIANNAQIATAKQSKESALAQREKAMDKFSRMTADELETELGKPENDAMLNIIRHYIAEYKRSNK